MNKVLPLIGATIAGFIMFLVAQGIGEETIDVLKGTGGMVTSSEIIEFRYVFPVAISIISAYIAYWLIKKPTMLILALSLFVIWIARLLSIAIGIARSEGKQQEQGRKLKARRYEEWKSKSNRFK